MPGDSGIPHLVSKSHRLGPGWGRTEAPSQAWSVSAGEHPRMGALDVCPFIPVRGVTMDECVLCAQAFGQRLAEELGVPGECRVGSSWV